MEEYSTYSFRWALRPKLLLQFPFIIRVGLMYGAICGALGLRSVPFGVRILSAARKLCRERSVLISFNDIRLFVDIEDNRFPLVVTEIIELWQADWWKDLIGPGDSFLDLGANHGSFSVIAAHHVGKSGKVVAIEPNAKLAGLVERSLLLSPSPFEVHRIALGDDDGTATFYLSPEYSGGGTVLPERVKQRHLVREMSVPIKRLDQAIEWRNLPGRVLIKIDVEGFELPLILGAQKVLTTRRPTILMEIHANTDRSILAQTLLNFGYTSYRAPSKNSDSFPIASLDAKLRHVFFS